MQNPAASGNICRIFAAIMVASSWPSRDRVVGHITARLLITRVWDHHSQWDIIGDLYMGYILGSSRWIAVHTILAKAILLFTHQSIDDVPFQKHIYLIVLKF